MWQESAQCSGSDKSPLYLCDCLYVWAVFVWMCVCFCMTDGSPGVQPGPRCMWQEKQEGRKSQCEQHRMCMCGEQHTVCLSSAGDKTQHCSSCASKGHYLTFQEKICLNIIYEINLSNSLIVSVCQHSIKVTPKTDETIVSPFLYYAFVICKDWWSSVI